MTADERSQAWQKRRPCEARNGGDVLPLSGAARSLWLIALVGLAFALLPAWSDDVQLRESLLLAAVYITWPAT